MSHYEGKIEKEYHSIISHHFYHDCSPYLQLQNLSIDGWIHKYLVINH